MSNEQLPVIRLNMGDKGEFAATPDNAALYTFAGKTLLDNGDTIDNSSRNHIFLTTGTSEDGETTMGTYIFSPESVQAMGAVMLT